jgi:hypothetical protein
MIAREVPVAGLYCHRLYKRNIGKTQFEGNCMKRITYIICTILIAAGYVSTGELFMLYLDNFQDDYYQATFGLGFVADKNVDEAMKKDISSAAEKYQVDYFFVDDQINDDASKSIFVYGTDEALAALKRNGIESKYYNSMFVGSADVRLEPYSNIENISKHQQIYFVGGKEKRGDMDRFKADIVDQYGGGFPRLVGNPMEIWIDLVSVWLLVCVFILLLLLYKALYAKKENAVRIVLGEDAFIIFRNNAIADAGTLLLLSALLPLLLHWFTNSYFKIQNIRPFLILLIFLSVLINLSIFRINFKKDLSSARAGSGLLIANYSVKSVTVAMAVFVLSGGLVEASNAIDAYSQKPFFESHNTYSYYTLAYVTDYTEEERVKDALMNQDFYRRFQEKALWYVDLSQDYTSTYPCVLVNGKALDEISKEYPLIKDAMKGKGGRGYYILYPKEVSADSPEYEEGIVDLEYFRNAAGRIKPVQYDGRIEVVAIMRDGGTYDNGSRIYRNPILLVNSTLQEKDLQEAEISSWNYSTMYDITPAEFQGFVKEHELGNQYVSEINVQKEYERNWGVISRGMQLTAALAILLMLLELALILFILRSEYRQNAVEMALKKVCGYTVFERCRRLLALTIISGGASVLAVILIALKAGISNYYYLACAGLILILAEAIIVLSKAKAIESQSIPRILKGEA